MKREFGFTQVRFRYQSVMPTQSIQNPARPKPREVTHTTVMLSEAKHLKSRPTKTPRSRPTFCLSAPAALQSGAQGQFANRHCCAWQLMHSMLANPPSTYG